MKKAAQLQEENNFLRQQLAAEKEKIVDRDTQIAALNEQIQLLLKKRFAPSSEKSSPDQLGLFNEAEELETEESEVDVEATTTVKSHTRKNKPRVTLPEHLPREEIIHDLREAEKVCPHDGSELKNIGSEDHEQLEIIPAQIKVIRHKRLKYACPCCQSHMITAQSTYRKEHRQCQPARHDSRAKIRRRLASIPTESDV